MKCGSWLFTRDIPDFPDCVVEGRNLLEALDGTRKRLAVRLAEMVAQNLPLPQESLLDEISWAWIVSYFTRHACRLVFLPGLVLHWVYLHFLPRDFAHVGL